MPAPPHPPPQVVDAWKSNAFREPEGMPAPRLQVHGIDLHPDDTFVPGQLLVRFKEDLDPERRDEFIDNLGAAVVRTVDRSGRLLLLQMDTRVDVDAMVAGLSSRDEVDAAEPNYLHYKAALPNDPDFSQYWALDNLQDIDINAPEAWDQNRGNNQIVVGVIDTGIDYDHIDLINNVWTNPAEIPGNGIDDDRNGWVDDLHGVDTNNNDADPDDDEGHGTHVAGTIAATGNNGIGGVGVMWQAQIVACKFLDHNGIGTNDGAIACLDYFSALKSAGVDIVLTNNSWGGGEYSELLRSAIENHNTRKILFVAAAGNGGSNNDSSPYYPSSYDSANIISVAAIEPTGALAYFSNTGRQTVDIAAPGTSILSTTPGDSWQYSQGTSMAAPHVAAVAGLLRANDPNMTMGEIRDHIFATGVPDPALATRVATGKRLRIDLPIVDDDDDGMPNWWEEQYGLNPFNPADAAQDLDGDGLTNVDEFNARSDPTNPDTDGDGLTDGDESNSWNTNPLIADSDGDGVDDRAEVQDHFTDPNNVDTDGDGLSDFDEITNHTTSPTDTDTDGDGLDDGWELEYEFDPLQAGEQAGDRDGDGLNNSQEFAAGTNPNDSDTDADGLGDGDEVNNYATDPLDDDTDGDRMPDGWEQQNNFDPLDGSDGVQDADSDGYSNRLEYRRGTDPHDPLSLPALDAWYTEQGNAGHTGFVELYTDADDFSFRMAIESNLLTEDPRRFVIADQRLYANHWSENDFHLSAFSIATGTTLWQYVFPDGPTPQVLHLDGERLVVPRQSFGVGGEVASHDVDTGERLSSYSVSSLDAEFAGTTFEGDSFYRDADEIVARDTVSGEVLWRGSLSEVDPYRNSSVAANQDYVTHHQMGVLDVFDQSTGAPIFQATVGDCNNSTRPGLILDDANRAFLIAGNCLAMIDLESQAQAWVAEIYGLRTWRVATDEKALYVATENGILALDLETGEEIWHYDDYASGDNIVVTGTHLFYTSGSRTVALDLQTREEVWHYDASGTLLISDDGSLVIVGSTRVHIINLEGDSDGDGMPNWWERYYRFRHLDPSDASVDADADGLTNVEEFDVGTSPIDKDSDDDGLLDGAELNSHATDPLDADSDDDGLSDGDEIDTWGTNPNTVDTDGDQISDGDEVNSFGTDPSDPASVPDLLRFYRESFESGRPDDWRTPTAAVAGWTVVEDDASQGRFSLKSEPINRRETAAIEWRQVFAAGELAFDARLNASVCCDRLQVYLDEEQVLDIRYPGWDRNFVRVPSGEHTIRFAYTRDSIGNGAGDAAWIDNVEYFVPRPIATDPNHFLILSRDGLREVDESGELVRLPFDLGHVYNELDVVVTGNRDVVVGYRGLLHKVDAATGNYLSLTVPGWYSTGSGLTDIGDLLYSPNAWDPQGIAVIDIDGNLIDTLAPGQQYIDVYTGPSGDLWALRNNGVVDRISTADGSLQQSLNVGAYANALAVDEAGSIFVSSSYDRLLEKYDASGNLLDSVEIGGHINDLDIGNDGRIVGSDQGGLIWFVAPDFSDIDFFDFDDQGSATSRVEPVPAGGDDNDSDGMPDWWETANRLNPANSADAAEDPDGDGLNNISEYFASSDPHAMDTDVDGLADGEEVLSWYTDPTSADSDKDGLSDFAEVMSHGTDPNLADTDSDGLQDATEIGLYQTDPNDPDTDGDGIADGWEAQTGLDPSDPQDAARDADGDGLTNLEEFLFDTDLWNSDSDLDGLTDADEVKVHFTNPNLRDSDGDTLRDGWEVQHGFDPLADGEAFGDADGDGYSNRVEYFSGSDPTSATSVPRISDWSTHQGNAQHTGFVPVEVDSDYLEELWTVRPFGDAALFLQQVAADKRRAYVTSGNYSGYQALAALDSKTGEALWLQEFGNINEASAPALADNRVYVQTGGHEDSFLRGFEADTGNPSIQTGFPAQWPNLFAPVPFEGDLYGYAGYFGGIASFSGSASTQNWWLDLSYYDAWSPIATADSIYVYSPDGLHAIDRLAGTLNYTIEDRNYDWQGYSAFSSPLLDERGNVLVSQRNRVVYFDTKNQSIAWEFSTSDDLRQLTLAENTVYAKVRSEIIAVDVDSGGELWRFSPPEAILHPMIATIDHLIAAGTTSTFIYDRRTLQLEATIAHGGKLSLSPDGILFIASDTGELTAVRVFGDRDRDGMADDWELQVGFDPGDAGDAAQDADGDGIANVDEYRLGTDPFSNDSDSDGLKDGDEVNLYYSSPSSADTDKDGLSDSDEVNVHGTNPADPDSDDDGLDDFEEATNYLTDPNNSDSDGDGVDDRTEIRLRADPNDPLSLPQPMEFLEESFKGPQLPHGWYQPAGSNAAWAVTSRAVPDGNQWLMSQSIAHKQSAAIAYFGFFGDGVIAFDARVQAEYCCDILTITLDDRQTFVQRSGDWKHWQIPVQAGYHEIRFSYSKDGSVIHGDDRAYIDNFTFFADADLDSIPDAWEIDVGLDSSNKADASEDPDLDLLTNIEEYEARTSPFNDDTDADGMDDGWEVRFGLDPLADDADQDTDADGVTNIAEYQGQTDPRDSSSKPAAPPSPPSPQPPAPQPSGGGGGGGVVDPPALFLFTLLLMLVARRPGICAVAADRDSRSGCPVSEHSEM